MTSTTTINVTSGTGSVPFRNSKIKFEDKPKISSLKEAEDVFALLGVTRFQDNNLRIFDFNEKYRLALIHYLHPNDDVSHVKGTIIQLGEKPKIVAQSFPNTKEYTYSEFTSSKIDHNLTFDGKQEVVLCKEGTFLRVFYVESNLPEQEIGQKWFISSHKNIDSTSKRWSGPTFGEMFSQAWPDFNPETLEKNTCYTYLVSHPQNRLVCNIPKPDITLVSTFTRNEKNTMTRVPLLFLPAGFNVPLPINNIYELLNEVANLDYTNYSGVLYSNFETGQHIKLVPDAYQRLREFRGNEPKLSLRYLQLCESRNAHELEALFPEYDKTFLKIKRGLYELPNNIIPFYKTRYYARKYERYIPELHYLLVATYEHYNDKFSLGENIVHRLSETPARNLYTLLLHFKSISN